MSRPIGWALIGAGIMGKRMTQRVASNPNLVLRAVYDPYPTGDNYSGVAWSSSLDEAINHPDVEVVYIASPPHAHKEAVEKAIAASKAVFCEKPLAARIEDIDALDRLAFSSTGIRTAVNFPFAYAANIKQLEIAVREGKWAKQPSRARIYLRFRTWPRPWQQGAAAWLTDAGSGGGFAREVLSHFLFLSLRLLGTLSFNPSNVQVTKNEKGMETGIKANGLAGSVPLTIDAAIEGEIDDSNAFELYGIGEDGSEKVIGLRNWIDLNWYGEFSTPQDENANAGVALHQWLRGPTTGHQWRLATFSEAAQVARTVETLVG